MCENTRHGSCSRKSNDENITILGVFEQYCCQQRSLGGRADDCGGRCASLSALSSLAETAAAAAAVSTVSMVSAHRPWPCAPDRAWTSRCR